MQYQQWQAVGQRAGVRQALAGSREKFIVRTYNHLFLAIVAFALIEIGLFLSGLAPLIAQAMLGTSWLLVLGGFIIVSWLASRVAHRSDSLPKQYAALAAFVAVGTGGLFTHWIGFAGGLLAAALGAGAGAWIASRLLQGQRRVHLLTQLLTTVTEGEIRSLDPVHAVQLGPLVEPMRGVIARGQAIRSAARRCSSGTPMLRRS